jgi:YVTN family beta-propeller protein
MLPRLLGSLKRAHGLPALLALCLLVVIGQAQYLETTIGLAGSPLDMVWNEATGKLYVSTTAGLVTVIDGVTNQVRAEIAVGDYPRFLCCNSVNNKVYASNGDPDWLYVIDGVGDSLIKRVRMRGYPASMAFNAGMNKLYVLCLDDMTARVFDGSTETLLTEVWFGDHSYFEGLLWVPVTNRVFVVSTFGSPDTIYAIGCLTDSITERLPVGDLQDSRLVWSPVNNLVYVKGYRAVYATTPNGDSVVAQIPVDYPIDICAVPYPNKLYVSGDSMVRVIDCNTNTVVDSTPVPSLSLGVLVCDAVKGKVYASGRPGVVFDARADTVIMTIPAHGSSSDHFCWSTTYSRIYWTLYDSNAVLVIRDTSTAIAEPAAGQRGQRALPSSVVTRTLEWTGQKPAALLDLCGRIVAQLKQGRNDLSRLGPGVYFIREKSVVSSQHTERPAVTKVVKLR